MLNFPITSSLAFLLVVYLMLESKLNEELIAAIVSGFIFAFGALIFGTVSMGIFYTDVDTDWFKVFLGAMMLIAVIFNNYIRRKVTESK